MTIHTETNRTEDSKTLRRLGKPLPGHGVVRTQ
jgi:hypothetical protein